MNQTEMKKIAAEVRKNIVRMTCAAQSGHPGGSLSAVEILVSLYFNEMKINEENVNDVCRDKFVLSKGHASPVLYSVLKEKGFISQEDLMTFRKIDSEIQGHPNMSIKGVDMSTGSLGQGFSCAMGIALASKIRKDGATIYTIIGDGESQEGQIWEAAMFGAQQKLSNVIAFTDYNNMQIDGDVSDICDIADLGAKWRAFGWHTIELEDGHDLAAIDAAITEAKQADKPSMIILNTVKGKGVKFIEEMGFGNHSIPMTKEQMEAAIAEIRGE